MSQTTQMGQTLTAGLGRSRWYEDKIRKETIAGLVQQTPIVAGRKERGEEMRRLPLVQSRRTVTE